MRRHILILAFFCTPIFAISQIFTDAAPNWGIVQYNWDGQFGAGLTAADWNRDGWDDLTFGNSNGAVRTFVNTGDGGFEMMALPVIQEAETKAIQWVDIDEDYDLDFFMNDRYGRIVVLENIGDTAFVDITEITNLPQDSVACAGVSWGDYDNDGDLDLHICRYIESPNLTDPLYRNVLMRNDGDFVFTNVSSEAQINIYTRLSFQSIWFDWDGDGWQDIYVINDKDGANSLYHNQQNGMFAEIASNIGADVVLDAMTASLGDFNQDGHQDIFMTSTVIGNDGIGSQLLVGSENGWYHEDSEEYGINFARYCWGAAWIDVDNDTDLDLFVAESNPLVPYQENYLYENHGPYIEIPPFSDEESAYFMEPFGTDVYGLDLLNSNSVVTGDFDRNGWVDFVVHNTHNHKARIWMNSGFNNDPPQYIQLGVMGTISNTMGIGAEVTVTDNGLSQTRIIHCGENYLGQESFFEHYGLGVINDISPGIVEKVKIVWPSGIVEVWENIEETDRRIFVEGGSNCDGIEIPNSVICPGEVVEHLVPEAMTGAEMLWVLDDSEVVGTGNTVELTQPGEYQMQVNYLGVIVCSVGFEISVVDIAGDFNQSGSIGSGDLLVFLTDYGCAEGCESTDLTGDGTTTVDDLLEFLTKYGTSC